MTSWINGHRIRCPKCKSEYVMTHNKGIIFNNFWHHCEDCGYEEKYGNDAWFETMDEALKNRPDEFWEKVFH